MANNVFANGLEIACKAADGKAIAAFPDPCFTPPSPPAGWIPVPYPNTAYAKDTANASKTVMISGKPVMKKDVSYFKTSTGNEAAAGPKGVVSGVKKGKAYFTSWSMNVKVEGKNVDRHTDMTTHNHGSKMGNAGPWYYADEANSKTACQSTRNKVEKKCKGENKGESAWKKNHCGKAKNEKDKYDKKKKKLAASKTKFKKLEQEIAKTMQKVGGMQDKLEKMAAEKALKLAAKAGVKSWLGPIGWAWTAYDVVSAGLDVYEAYEEIDKVLASIKDTKEEMDRIIKEGAKLEKEIGSFADNLVAAVSANECLKARRCILHRHGNAAGACCTGQTSHHLVPNAMFQEAGTRKSGGVNIEDCPNYSTADAPCMCVEGFTQNQGTHKIIHDNTDNLLPDYIENGKLSIKNAKGAAIAAHQDSFSSPKCSKRCLESQLNAYFNEACKKTSSVRPVDSHGNQVSESSMTQEDL